MYNPLNNTRIEQANYENFRINLGRALVSVLGESEMDDFDLASALGIDEKDLIFKLCEANLSLREMCRIASHIGYEIYPILRRTEKETPFGVSAHLEAHEEEMEDTDEL